MPAGFSRNRIDLKHGAPGFFVRDSGAHMLAISINFEFGTLSDIKKSEFGHQSSKSPPDSLPEPISAALALIFSGVQTAGSSIRSAAGPGS